MVRASHGERGFVATRIFTDREEPTGIFEEALARPQSAALETTDAYRVLVWYGVGGQGKTALRRELQGRLEARRKAGACIALGVLDFENAEHRSLMTAMLHLRLELGRGRSIGFPTFDLAFARLFALERPGDDIRTAHPGLFRKGESEIVDDVIDWSENLAEVATTAASMAIPGANLLYKYGHRLAGRLRDWWESREVKSRLVGLDELSASALLERLPVFLGFDLWRALHEEDPPRVALMIDSYEALWRDAAAVGALETLRTDGWVRALVEEAPGVLVAIFSRDRLRWGEVDAEWEGVLDQRPLDGLSDPDADRFLRTAGVPTPGLRARIVAASHRLPFYLDLALDQFEDIARQGRVPEPDEFGSTPAEILERFHDHLAARERVELRLASYPTEIDEALFGELAEAFLGGGAGADWGQLMRRSFMVAGMDGRANMHALMREALQAREKAERPNLFRRIHLWLFERYDRDARSVDARSVTERHDRALVASVAQLRVAAPDRIVGLIAERWGVFQCAARWQALDRVLSIAGDALGNDGAPEPASWIFHHRAIVSKAMGRMTEAEEGFMRAIAIRRAAFGPGHESIRQSLLALSELRDPVSFRRQVLFSREPPPKTDDERAARARRAAICEASVLGDRLFNGRHFDEAEASFRKLLQLQTEDIGRGHPDIAMTLRKLGEVLTLTERYEEAVALLEEAVAVEEVTIGRRYPDHALTLIVLARARIEAGHGTEVDALCDAVLEIVSNTQSERGPKHAGMLCALALIRLKGGRASDALALCDAALSILEGEPPGIRGAQYNETLTCQALCLAALGRREAAREAFDNAVMRLRDAPWGANKYLDRALYLRGVFLAEESDTREAGVSDIGAAAYRLADVFGAADPWTREARDAFNRFGATDPRSPC